MHVIWKRPDGFHNSSPSDFKVIVLDGHIKFWLHKDGVDWFPFQISGDWKGADGTQRINSLINLIESDDSKWISTIKGLNSDSMNNSQDFYKELCTWVNDLNKHLKGDTWELEIMQHAIKAVEDKLVNLESHFSK